MRDPFEYLRDRVEGRVMRNVNRKKAKVNGVVNKASRGVADQAEGAYDKRFGGKKGAAAAQAQAQADKKKKKKMSWWPFGGDDDEAQIPACGSCGNEVDASWRVCPHCSAQLGAGPELSTAVGAHPPRGVHLVAAAPTCGDLGLIVIAAKGPPAHLLLLLLVGLGLRLRRSGAFLAAEALVVGALRLIGDTPAGLVDYPVDLRLLAVDVAHDPPFDAVSEVLEGVAHRLPISDRLGWSATL